LFQSAATELAATANVYLGEGDAARQVWLDRRLWDSFASVRFLLEPDHRLRLYSDSPPKPLSAPALLLAWPYEDLRAATGALPSGAIIAPSVGSLYRGDLEPEPYVLVAAYRSEVCSPDTCPATAQGVFEIGLRLLAVHTRAQPGGLRVELTWQTPEPLGRPVQVAALAYRLEENEIETLLAQADGPLGTEWYPSEWWRAGEIVRETRRFSLRNEALSAPFVLRIGLYDPVTGARYARSDHPSDLVEIVYQP
jgi:hypothetical protein